MADLPPKMIYGLTRANLDAQMAEAMKRNDRDACERIGACMRELAGEDPISDTCKALAAEERAREPKPQVRVKLDIASVETNGDPHKIELRLDVVRAGARYLIGIADDHSAHIDGVENGYTVTIDTNTGIGRELIGYALRRAICRGIAKSEVTETRSKINGVDTNVVRIDLGVLK